jgi:CDP-diacylglycerol--glycerol-3-phosphate 3-phosphatidyltransferase
MDLRKEQIPWAMAAGRALLGPVLILGETSGWNGLTMAWLVVTALVSDIFDGVLARRWKCDTAGVRLFDSMADTVFYLGVAIALWIGHPQVLRDDAGLLAALGTLEALRFGVDFAKFGKPASYHSYLAKAWGLVMAIAVVAVFGSRHASPLIPAALALGIACDLEGLAMSLLLPVWRKDVKTLRVAWALRVGSEGQMNSGDSSERSLPSIPMARGMVERTPTVSNAQPAPRRASRSILSAISRPMPMPRATRVPAINISSGTERVVVFIGASAGLDATWRRGRRDIPGAFGEGRPSLTREEMQGLQCEHD